MAKSNIKIFICRAQKSGLPFCTSQAALDALHLLFLQLEVGLLCNS